MENQHVIPGKGVTFNGTVGSGSGEITYQDVLYVRQDDGSYAADSFTVINPDGGVEVLRHSINQEYVPTTEDDALDSFLRCQALLVETELADLVVTMAEAGL